MDVTHSDIIKFLIGSISLIGGITIGLLIWLMQDFHRRLSLIDNKSDEKYKEYLIRHAEIEQRISEIEGFVDNIRTSYLVLRKDLCK